jgi:molybdopterin-containing oxidoreductase family iron-sulfur binding subunit
MMGICRSSQALSAGSVDYSAAASTLSRSKAAAGFELVLYTKKGMGDGQQANNPCYKSFLLSRDNYDCFKC